MISGLAHVCFLVNDLASALAFYRDLLGLEMVFEFKNDQDECYGFFLHCGQGQFLEFFQSTAAQVNPRPPFDHICLKTEDIDKLHRHLADAGLCPSLIKTGKEGARSFRVQDPFGIKVEFHQYPSSSIQAKISWDHQTP